MTLNCEKAPVQWPGRLCEYPYKRQDSWPFPFFFMHFQFSETRTQYLFLETSQTFFLLCFPTFNTLFLAHSQKLLVPFEYSSIIFEQFLGFPAAVQRTLHHFLRSSVAFNFFFLQKGRSSGLLSDFEYLFFFFLPVYSCFSIRLRSPFLLVMIVVIIAIGR